MIQDPPVNSWDEWGTLREIVVGSADGACFEPEEQGNRPAVRSGRTAFPQGRKPPEVIARANEELAGLVEVLRREGVTVRRPKSLDFDRGLRTPHFEVKNQYCAVCPRDVMITFGNEIIEATMSRRARYFEYEAYRRLVYEYWQTHPGVRWTVAPKPSMADGMYRQEFWDWPLAERYARMHAFEFCITQDEVVFDAADISRFGRDVFVQESMTTNRNGVHWLRRHLEPQGFRVHTLHFPLDLFPSHIDCTFVPLRAGVVLTNPDRPLLEPEAQIFRDNDWKMVDAPQPVLANADMPEHCQSSHWLSMNVLSLSPDKVICEAEEYPLHELLSGLGFEVITVPFRNVFEFGGSLHCATWDIHRDGDRGDYFPSMRYEPLRP